MKKILSIVLTMLMLLSVLCAAPISTGAAQVTLADTSVDMTGGEVLYLVPNSNWTQAGARFAIYVYGTGDAWASMTKVEGEDNLYEVTVPDGNWTNVIFCRMNPGTTDNNWDNKWTQTGDLTYDGTNNCFSINANSWDAGTWSVYAPSNEGGEGGSTVEPEPDPEPDPEIEYMTIYFENNWSWTNPTIYYWGSAGTNPEMPGLEMTYVDTTENDADRYTVEVPTDIAGMIFVGTGGYGEEQCTDITEGWYDGICYYMTYDAETDSKPAGSYEYAPIAPPTTGDEPVVDSYTVYFVDYADNFSKVYAYAYTGEDIPANDPGFEMNLTGDVTSEGGLVYSCTFEKEYENIIFYGFYDDDSMAETQELEFTANQYCYWGDELWYDSLEALEKKFAYESIEWITVYFQNNWLWSDVKIYYWGSESVECSAHPGELMDYYDNDGTYDVYCYQIPADAVGFLINGIKDDGTGTLDKTPDITENFYDGACYSMMWDNGNAVYVQDISVLFPDVPVEETKAELKGYTITLGGTIGINFFFDISEDVLNDADAKVVFTVPDTGSTYTVEVPVSELTWDEATGYYYATCYVAAKEMTSTITAQLVTSLLETDIHETTVQAYAVYMLEHSDEYAAEQALVKALLNYGAASQVYFNYNTDKLANDTEFMTEEDKTITQANIDSYAPVIEGEGDIVKFVGATLTLKSETSLNFYFTVSDETVENPSINVNGLAGARLEKNGDLYVLTIENISAHELGDAYTLMLDNDCTITYSALSYAYLAQQSSKQSLVDVANALAAYYSQVDLYWSE